MATTKTRSSRAVRNEIVGKCISGVIARPGRNGEPPMVMMLQFDDGSVIEFVSPRSDRVLKNAIDWASRPDPDDAEAPAAWQGRVAAILSATPGGLGGIRGLIQLRTVLSGIGVHVIPRQLGVGSAHEVVTESGTIDHDGWRERVGGVVDDLMEIAGRLHRD